MDGGDPIGIAAGGQPDAGFAGFERAFGGLDAGEVGQGRLDPAGADAADEAVHGEVDFGIGGAEDARLGGDQQVLRSQLHCGSPVM